MAEPGSPDGGGRHMHWARTTVVAVFVLGLVVVVGPALWHPGSLFKDPFTTPVERRTVETFDANGNRTGTVVTTEPGDGSLVDRALSSGGVLLLRLAVVAAAAFLAGALVDRTMSGSFPSEIAGVKFAEQAGAGLEQLRATVDVLGLNLERLDARLEVADSAVKADIDRLKVAGTRGVTAVGQLNEEVAATRAQVGHLTAAVRALGDGLAEVSATVETLRAGPRPPSRSRRPQ